MNCNHILRKDEIPQEQVFGPNLTQYLINESLDTFINMRQDCGHPEFGENTFFVIKLVIIFGLGLKSIQMLQA